VKQCAVMFVSPARDRKAHPSALKAMGFVVQQVTEWPADSPDVRDYHVVIVAVKDVASAPMLAARFRAKPHVSGRLLIALVPASATVEERRAAGASGFDDVVNDCCDSRQLAARILRGLRLRPGLRCLLPPPTPRRPAA
jgi:hypothetical protein